MAASTFEGGEPAGDASSGDEHSTRQEASLQLADFLMSLNVRGELSAKDVCTIAPSGQAMWRDKSGHRLELPKRCAEWTLPASPDCRFELGHVLGTRIHHANSSPREVHHGTDHD